MQLGENSSFDLGYSYGYRCGVDYLGARDVPGPGLVPRDASINPFYVEGWNTGAAKKQEEERISALPPAPEPVVVPEPPVEPEVPKPKPVDGTPKKVVKKVVKGNGPMKPVKKYVKKAGKKKSG